MVNSLLAGKADLATLLIAQRATTNLTGGRFRANINHVVGKFAESRSLTVARVVSPIELTDAQVKRLERLLYKKYGLHIEANVSIDPAAIGGLRVEVGDRVLDDTVRARLYDAERHFANPAGPGDLRGTELTDVKL
jgi:F-type H+-transporting ATPase subunit delta